MKRTFRIMPFQVVEYKAVEEYLNSMAVAGYAIKNIRGYYFTFEKKVYENEHYVVDFNGKYSFFTNNGRTPDTEDYIQLVEEYGYEFVTSSGPILVYKNTTNVAFPIREESVETTKQFHKAAHRSGITSILLAIGFLVIALLWCTSNEVILFLRTETFISIFLYLLLAIFWFVQSIAYLKWVVHKDRIFTIQAVKRCAFAMKIILGFLSVGLPIMLLYLLPETMISSNDIIMIIFIIVCGVLFALCLNALHHTRIKKGWKVFFTIVLMYVFFIGLMQTTLTSSFNRLEAMPEPISEVYMSDRSPFAEHDYMEYPTSNDETIQIELYTIKDTFLKGWLSKGYLHNEVMKNALCEGMQQQESMDGIAYYKGTYCSIYVNEKKDRFVKTSNEMVMKTDTLKYVKSLLMR